MSNDMVTGLTYSNKRGNRGHVTVVTKVTYSNSGNI